MNSKRKHERTIIFGLYVGERRGNILQSGLVNVGLIIGLRITLVSCTALEFSSPVFGDLCLRRCIVSQAGFRTHDNSKAAEASGFLILDYSRTTTLK